MKKILHILKKKEDRFPLDIIQKEAGPNEVTVLLIQEAVDLDLNGSGAKVFVLSDDAGESKLAYPRVGYKEMLDFILNADTVVTW
ncbi:MAG TPA: hypothetical protein VFA47_10510 [Candidatus Manganitrophaceae bacterium]|nr:hypothetical protein [Candidatus Manganitrophaceae bacterium]